MSESTEKVIGVVLSNATTIEILAHLAGYRSLVESAGLSRTHGGRQMLADSERLSAEVESRFLGKKVS